MKIRATLSPSILMIFSLASGFFSAGCYTLRWTEDRATVPAPTEITRHFTSNDAGEMVMTLDLVDPGKEYGFDNAEMDAMRSVDERLFHFDRAEILLPARIPVDRVPVAVRFFDKEGTVVKIHEMDLLRLVPKIDTRGELQYVELFNEEYNRYGVSLRKEHYEFEVRTTTSAAEVASERISRLGVTNNCLDPTKWEFALQTDDYSDFKNRLESPLTLNQSRLLAHSWFYIDRDFYDSLIRYKNPNLEVPLDLLSDYEALSRRGEEVKVDFSQLRTIKSRETVHLLELGSATARPLKALDSEQYYKWRNGLFVNRDQFPSYREMLTGTVQLAPFEGRGFYDPRTPKEFNYEWMRNLDAVAVDRIENDRANTFVEITIGGENSPYFLRMGNVDLAHVEEQRLLTLAFGVNTYPLSRRSSPSQSTIKFDEDLMPNDIKPYLFLIDQETGHWVDHEKLGIERIYIGWENIDHDVLEIYVVSYERITPIWMARCKVNDELVDRARVRRSFFGP